MSNLSATILTIFSAAIMLIFGFTYLIKDKFMSYHSVALKKNWEELDTQMQTFIKALMRVISGGSLSSGFTIMFLQYQFNKLPQHWIALTVLICGGILGLSSLFGMLMIRTKTDGRPPIFIVLIALFTLIIGYFLNINYLP